MISALDTLLMNSTARQFGAARRALTEFLYFGIKNARSCLFVFTFMAAVLLMPRAGIDLGLFRIARYDVLLIVAIAIQWAMLKAGLETVDELKAVCLFHAIGFALEAFKVSASVASWSYPDAALTKIYGVPLFAGFMYASIGSYLVQAWRLFDIRIRHHPSYWAATLIAVLIYANFFTHHYIGDYRWYLAACALGLYSRTTVIFRPLDRDRQMPLLLSFVLIGFFIWLAENISTFVGVWRYPNQLGAWSLVHLSKWSSWSLLVIMTFTIVASLKHIKARIHVPA